MTKEKPTGLELLRMPFEPHHISKLPKGTKAQNECPNSEKVSCKVCGGWHHPRIIHLDYVGHAALTDRLLDADPLWAWEPLAVKDGLPAFDSTGGLWIKLTVCGHTRLGYGHAQSSQYKEIGSREKEVIGDALRNAAMRFGAALDLWHKGELHVETDPLEAGTGVIKPSDGSGARIAFARKEALNRVKDSVIECMKAGDTAEALKALGEVSDADEKVYVWDMIDSKMRAAIKKAKAALPPPAEITDAQKKRLEAHIHALKVDRDAVKAYCKEQFGKDHFADLTNEEYETTYSQVEFMSLPSSAAQVASHHNAGQADSPAASSPDAVLPSDDDLVADIEKAVKKKDWDAAHDLCRSIADEALRANTEKRINTAHKYVSDKAAA